MMPQQRAFSLVELSIVLVILGLLVGGVLSGQSLIHASELRAVTRDLDTYRVATNTFKDKYFMLPGDINNAYAIWRNDPNCTSNTLATVANHLGCNGNGDGAVSGTTGEPMKFWYHLSLAGLVNGGYDGVYVDGFPQDFKPGQNAPKGPTGGNAYFAGVTTSLFIYGWTAGDFSDSRLRLIYTNGPGTVLSAEDSWNLDTKMDDGKPGTGLVTVHSSCTTGGTNTNTAVYNIGTSGVMCEYFLYKII